MGLRIDDGFFGGSIEVVRVRAKGPVELALRGDTAAEFSQWFAFDVEDDTQRARELVIRAAGDATYPGGFEDFEVMASEDGLRWRHAPTRFEDGDLLIDHEPRGPLTRYAYFATYDLARLERTLGKLARDADARVDGSIRSVEDRPVYVASLGAEDAARTLWIIASQHPGETPATWLAHGLARRLRAGDRAVRRLLADTRLCIAPLVNVDGAALGNMRTGATGADMNRCWQDPDADDTPEIAGLLERIDETGCDLFLDVHADEDCGYAFPAGCEGNPSWSDALAEAEAALREDLAAAIPEFVDDPFYELDAPGEADLSCAANAIGERFGCVSLTLELPIKATGGGRVRRGWSPKRAARAGERMVDALLAARARMD
jgi:murein tripeptide amidase MpaA